MSKDTNLIEIPSSFDELKSIWANNGADYGGMTQQQFAAFVSGEVKRWSDVVKASGAKLD